MSTPKPTGARLRLLMRLRSQRALDTWRKELAKGAGVYAACEALDVSKTTAYRLAADWPALAKILEHGTPTPAERGSVGGTVSQEVAAADPRITARRVRAIRKASKARK